MTLRDFVVVAKALSLPVSDAYDVASFITGKDYDEVKSSYFLDIEDEACLEIISRWEKGEPTAYIIGRKEFFGRIFKTTPDVLIPRPETEMLVDEVLKDLECKPLRILDLCTGSGCIILSILGERKEVSGLGVDISETALKVAEDNAMDIGLTDRVKFIKADALDFDSGEHFDVVVCNPPYISEKDYSTLEKQIKYEPKLALTANDNGLYFYKKILNNIHKLCKTGGKFYFEIGFDQGKSVSEIAYFYGLRVKILKDLSGHDRVICGLSDKI